MGCCVVRVLLCEVLWPSDIFMCRQRYLHVPPEISACRQRHLHLSSEMFAYVVRDICTCRQIYLHNYIMSSEMFAQCCVDGHYVARDSYCVVFLGCCIVIKTEQYCVMGIISPLMAVQCYGSLCRLLQLNGVVGRYVVSDSCTAVL